MNRQNLYTEITDLFKYNWVSKDTVSPRSFTGHSHNLYEILYFLKGDATYVIEDKKYKLKSGDVIITRPSKYHFIQMDSDKGYERHNFLFDHKRLGIDVSMLPDTLDVVNVKKEKIITDLFDKLSYYAEIFPLEKFVEIAKLLVQEMMFNLPLVESNKETGFSVINPILSKALAYIGENLFTIKDVAEVAREVFVTDSYLYRLFKRELFKSPKKYINEKRLVYAQNQLKKGEKPTDVAAECGFDDYTSFYRNYTEMFGKKPSDEKRA